MMDGFTNFSEESNALIFYKIQDLFSVEWGKHAFLLPYMQFNLN